MALDELFELPYSHDALEPFTISRQWKSIMANITTHMSLI